MTPPRTTAAPGSSFGGGRRSRGRGSQYGLQLREKQQLKGIYGLRDEQLRRYYRQARQAAGDAGSVLIQLLELRLDNAIFRAGFAETRHQARQMASHRFFLVNGRAITVPSFGLAVGDVVTVKESKRGKSYFTSFEKRMQNAALPGWLALDVAAYGFKVTGLPTPQEANVGVHTQAVIEFLAR